LRLGTRGSALALAQARWVAGLLGGEVEVVEVRTAGDRGVGPGDKSRWVDGLERALLAGEIDLAVHSAKDVPADLADGLELLAVPPREDPRDVVVVGAAASGAPPCDAGPTDNASPGDGAADTSALDALPVGARVGTTSLRRRAALLAARPDLDVVDLRGNVDTRLRKLAGGEADALVLALAGLRRLGRDVAGATLDPAVMLPAAGQGALALEGRGDDGDAFAAAASISDLDATTCVVAERTVTAALDATCYTPVAALASIQDGRLALAAFAALPDGSEWIRDTLTGDAADPEALGREVASRMRAAGAAALLARA
jgi:hydroxymethylbilane synthase